METTAQRLIAPISIDGGGIWPAARHARKVRGETLSAAASSAALSARRGTGAAVTSTSAIMPAVVNPPRKGFPVETELTIG